MNKHITISIVAMITLSVLATLTLPANSKFVNEDVFRKAPPAITGDNVYVAWWTNEKENSNEEVQFRASTDGGASFGEKDQSKQYD